jgi:tetratricopeptide (TPR) repeat protein
VDLLAQVTLLSQITPSPTPTFTPTPSPTPDFSGAESMFARVQELMAQEDWENAVYALDALRKEAPDYRAVDVDGLYYMALRNAGMGKILKDGELENGIYYLTQAERFGPLDGLAAGIREGARLYITGASFWELDWGQALYYFGQVYRTWPNLWDSASGYTARDRFRIASVRYGDLLESQGKWCQALQQYDNAQAIYADPQVAPTREAVYRKCHPPTPTPLPVTATPTPGAATPIPTPTP